VNTLPKRDVPALIEALRIRALALTGEKWERTATRDMMKEAADQLERAEASLAAIQAQRDTQRERAHAERDCANEWAKGWYEQQRTLAAIRAWATEVSDERLRRYVLALLDAPPKETP
jgi:hypothetical protein